MVLNHFGSLRQVDKSAVAFVIALNMANPQYRKDRELLETSGRWNYKLVRKLISEGANINAIGYMDTHDGYVEATPLMVSASCGDYKTTKLLLESGANINAQSDEGMTALMIAGFRELPKIVGLLVKYGAGEYIQNMHGHTVFDMFDESELYCFRGQFKKITEQTLIMSIGKRNKIMGIKDIKDLNRQLLLECKLGNVQKIQNLIEKGADINARGRLGFTPLILASGFGHNEVCKMLLENGAEINAQNKVGLTSLMIATYMMLPETVELLIENKADETLKDIKGKTVFDLMKGNREEIQHKKFSQKLKETTIQTVEKCSQDKKEANLHSTAMSIDDCCSGMSI